METENYKPQETRKTIWVLFFVIGFWILMWRLPDILQIFFGK